MRKRREKKYPKPVKKKGKTFRSQFESRVDSFMSKQEGLKFEYEKDTLKYWMNYNPDFSVDVPGRGVVFVETKGNFPSEDRSKMLAVKRTNPDADIRMVFMRDNKLAKSAHMRYSEWCMKHGFPFYVVGDSSRYLPKEWTEEFKG